MTTKPFDRARRTPALLGVILCCLLAPLANTDGIELTTKDGKGVSGGIVELRKDRITLASEGGPRSFRDSELDAASVRVLTALRSGGDLAEPSEAEKLRNENRVLREDNGKLRTELAALEKRLNEALGRAGAAPAAPAPQPLIGGSAKPIPTKPPVTTPGERAPPDAGSAALTHWLTTNSKARHNSGCKWYRKSKGRACTASEGKACGICGG